MRNAAHMLAIMACFSVWACDRNSPTLERLSQTSQPPVSSNIKESAQTSGNTQTGVATIDVAPQAEADQSFLARFPLEASVLGRSGARVDENGRLGRNREWGALYSPRFQLGAGLAVRMGLAGEDRSMISGGFAAIEAGLVAVEADGTVRSSLPQDRYPGAALSKAETASGAAFFLADICPALIVISNERRLASVLSSQLLSTARENTGRAIRWLSTRRKTLLDYDKDAPNRLLIDALAFQSCGKVIGDPELTGHATEFVSRALEFARGDGVFVEAGGG